MRSVFDRQLGIFRSRASMEGTTTKMRRNLGSFGIVAVLMVVAVAVAVSPGKADDTEYGALAFAGAFSILISGGVAVANAVALLRDAPSRPNGWFGVGFGTYSVVFASLVVIAAEGEGTSPEFAAVLGSAGVASIVFGVWNVHAASGRVEPVETGWRLSPGVGVEQGRRACFCIVLERGL
jgi:hypothetical protein